MAAGAQEDAEELRLLMLEMADAGESHGDVVFVGCLNNFRIANGAAGLDYGAYSVTCRFP